VTIRAIPDEVLALPCDTCGGPGWFFDDVYGLGACATCNDDEHPDDLLC